MRRLPVMVGGTSVLGWAAGATMLIFSWVEIGRRGEVADATHTGADPINIGEVLGVLFGLGLTGIGVFGFFVTAFLWRRQVNAFPGSVSQSCRSAAATR